MKPNLVGSLIRRRRRELGLGRKIVAQWCQVSPALLAEIETGRRHIDSMTIGYISEILQLASGELHRLAMEELEPGQFLPLLP